MAKSAVAPLLFGKSVMDTGAFIDALRSVSPGNLRALWLPSPNDTTTNLLKPDGRVWTNSATNVGRVTNQGNGILITFASASSHSVSTPDTDDLSFGNGTADSPFSLVVLANVTNTAAIRALISKDTYGGAAEEWMLLVNADDTWSFFLTDQSAGVSPRRISNDAATQGALTLFGTTYDGSGGATAMNGATLYENGAVKTSTATNEASYVAMENLSTPVLVGATRPATPNNFLDGSVGFAAVYAAALTAAQHRQINDLKREYYGLV